MFKKLGGKGNVLQVRGVKGSAPDHDMFEAQEAALKEYPDIKVVATVYGQATASVAQSAIANVLPSLPHVDAVLGQGGSDDFGIAQAFDQFGGPTRTSRRSSRAAARPTSSNGGRRRAASGYETISMNTTPGIGGAAFWLALEMVKGANPPKLMIMPVATVTQDNLKRVRRSPLGHDRQPHLFRGMGAAEPARQEVRAIRLAPTA